MIRLGIFAAGILSGLSTFALAAFAQSSGAQSSAPTPPVPGYGPMGGWGYGRHMAGWGHGFAFFHAFGAIIMILLFILLIIVLLRALGFGGAHGHGRYRYGYGRGGGALDILEERFARGEIDKAEFEEKRRLLTR